MTTIVEEQPTREGTQPATGYTPPSVEVLGTQEDLVRIVGEPRAVGGSLEVGH
jgi:hypothetical protein